MSEALEPKLADSASTVKAFEAYCMASSIDTTLSREFGFHVCALGREVPHALSNRIDGDQSHICKANRAGVLGDSNNVWPIQKTVG
jgi:hypothetical protein